MDAAFGLGARSAVDFRVVLPVPRLDLESMRDLRIARLNQVAREHFREALSHFFRRYAFNEWYPLNREEFNAYAEQAGRRFLHLIGRSSGASIKPAYPTASRTSL